MNIDKLDASPKDSVEITEVLAVSNGDFKVGNPFIAGAKVTLEVVIHGKDKKLVAFFKRRRQDSKRKVGFRREFTRVKVSKITV